MKNTPPQYVATPPESFCGQHSIVIAKPQSVGKSALASLSVRPPVEPAIYVVGPVKSIVETRASEVLSKLNQ